MSAPILVFMNRCQGGSGKTTTVANLALAYALRGASVLVIDWHAYPNLSHALLPHLMADYRLPLEDSAFRLFRDADTLAQQDLRAVGLAHCVGHLDPTVMQPTFSRRWEAVPNLLADPARRARHGWTTAGSVHLVMGALSDAYHHTFFEMQHYLGLKATYGRLRLALTQARDDFDIILVEVSKSDGGYDVVALSSCDGVLIPEDLDSPLASSNVVGNQRWVEEIAAQQARFGMDPLHILGVFGWLGGLKEARPADYKDLRELGVPYFTTVLPRQAGVSHGFPVLYSAPESPFAQAIFHLADEIDQHLYLPPQLPV